MSVTSVFMAVLPRIRSTKLCHKSAYWHSQHHKPKCISNSRQYGLACVTASTGRVSGRTSHLLKHNVRNTQRLSSALLHTLPCKIDRYQCVHCDVGDIPAYVTDDEFDVVLRFSLDEWKKAKKSGVWLQIPIVRGQLIPIAAKYGFEFHHAEGDTAVLCRWMKTGVPNKFPPYATHQVGVSGVVIRDDTQELLVVKDRNRPFTMWKFPGGLANLGEDISETVEREVLEETGIKTKFQGVLAFRQQHDHPNAFGRSDLFFVCHMMPLNYDIVRCVDEIETCIWMPIDELEESTQTSAITQRMIQLIRIGQKRGYEHVNLRPRMFQSVYKGLTFKIFNRCLDESNTDVCYIHSIAKPEQLYNKTKE